MEPTKIFKVMPFLPSDGNSVNINLYGEANNPIFSALQIGNLLRINNVQTLIQHFVYDEEKCHLFINGCDELGLTENGMIFLLTKSFTKTAWLLTCWVIRSRRERHQAAAYAAEMLRIQAHLLLMHELEMQLLAATAAAAIIAENIALARKLQILHFLQFRMAKEDPIEDFVIKGQSMLIDLRSQDPIGVEVEWTMAILTQELSDFFINDEAFNKITGLEKMVAVSGLYNVNPLVLKEYVENAKNSLAILHIAVAS